MRPPVSRRRPPEALRAAPSAALSGPRIKSPDLLIAESGADLEGHGLRRSMGRCQLICFGIGAIVGTGIFVGLSDTVAQAGPAVLVSFVLGAPPSSSAGVCCSNTASRSRRSPSAGASTSTSCSVA